MGQDNRNSYQSGNNKNVFRKILLLLKDVIKLNIMATKISEIEGIGPEYKKKLAAAGIINAFGLFGSEKISFSFFQFLGLGLMILGIIILKWKH